MLAASPDTLVDPDAVALTADKSDAKWLAILNRWRAEAAVAPVGENSGLSRGAQAHACYLVKNGPQNGAGFMQYIHTIGGAAHSENPGNPYFTKAGNEAAHAGDIAFDRTLKEDIDGWIQVPFHRLSLLAPWSRVAGYGDCGSWPQRAAVLVLRGSTPVGTTRPVLFPPDGSSVKGTMGNGEWPDPLAACPGYSFPAGTAITVQAGAEVKLALKSFSVRDQNTGEKVEACGFDSQTYPLEWGRHVLTSYGAVVVIPRRELTPDHTYKVEITTNVNAYSWSFHVEGAPGQPQVVNRKDQSL